MPTYEDLVELANICARHARRSGQDVAAILWKMAEDHQSKAVKLDSGKSPDIGEPPARLKGVLLALAQ
jgi:hypothetical protein